jgi:hypothetical protein
MPSQMMLRRAELDGRRESEVLARQEAVLARRHTGFKDSWMEAWLTRHGARVSLAPGRLGEANAQG